MKPILYLFSSLVAAAPSTLLEERQQQTLCQQYGYWSGAGYELNNNLWGKNAASSGSQCTYLDSASGGGIAWHTTWNWQGGQNNVKSYVYSGRQVPKGRLISSIGSMQTSVSWSYNTNNVRANVAYDLFTASDPNHSASSGDYELMIWLAKIGDIYPIGSSVGTVNVAGRSWNLWVGMNGAMKVFSFVAPTPMNSFSADVKQFYQYLQNRQGYPAGNQYLLTFQFGTEAFTGGPATMGVSQFSANVN